MIRTAQPGRTASRTAAKRASRPRFFRAHLEPLEDRNLLSVNPVTDDLLVATFDDTFGSSVLRYNETSNLRVPVGVYTGNNGLGHAEGLAVAPDGTFYVSSLNNHEVLHYS